MAGKQSQWYALKCMRIVNIALRVSIRIRVTGVVRRQWVVTEWRIRSCPVSAVMHQTQQRLAKLPES